MTLANSYESQKKCFIIILSSAIFVLSLFSSCKTKEPTESLIKIDGRSMGTSYAITIRQFERPIDVSSVRKRVESKLDSINQIFSTYLDNSEISVLNALPANVWQHASNDMMAVLTEAFRIYELSFGAFDPTVAPLINLWGFGSEKKPQGLPKIYELNAQLSRVGMHRLKVDPQTKQINKSIPALELDLSGIAKGYAVDEISNLLSSIGATHHFVEIGGEAKVRGEKANNVSWRIGIERPIGEVREIAHIIELSEGAVASSGDYRNFFEVAGIRYSHTLDPMTGKPIRHNTRGVTVVHDNCLTADGLATAFLVLGSARGLELAEKENLAVMFQDEVNGKLTRKVSTTFKREYE